VRIIPNKTPSAVYIVCDVRRKRLASEVGGGAVVAAQAPLIGLRGFNPISVSALESNSMRQRRLHA